MNGSYHHGDLKAALIEEAAAMIADGGIASVTMREIGRRVGVSRAAPYRHFADKAALLVAVAATGFERLHGRLASLSTEGRGAGGARRVQRMGEEYVRFALENPAHYRLMYGREALARRDVPELREAADALFEHLVSVIESQQAAGVLEPRDPRAMAYVAWSSVHGLASLLIDGQILSDVDVDALIRETTGTLMQGMGRA